MQTDNQLVRKIQRSGSRIAANELLERYYTEIYGYVYKQTGDREQAMDLTQDIFVAVLKGIPAYDGKKASFRTWLYHIASNKIADYYRSRAYRSRRQYVALEEGELPPVEDRQWERIFQRDMICHVMEVVSRFEPDRIRLFQKRCFEEKTFREIADEMKMPEGTVKSDFYRMIRVIQKEVADYE